MGSEPSAIVKTSRSLVSKPTSSAGASLLESKAAKAVAAAIGMAGAVALWLLFFAGPSIQAEQDRLAQMTAEKRAVVVENSQAFAALPESQQARIRDVASHIEQKSGSDQTIAKAAVREFQDWLVTLPMSDHDAIRQAATTADRQQAVEAVLARVQSERTNGQQVADFGRRRSFAISGERFPDLTAILERAAGRTPDTNRMPLIRTTEVLVSVLDQSESYDSRFERLSGLLAPKVCEEIFSLLPDQPERRMEIPGFMQPFVAARLVMESVDAERLRQISKFSPTPEQKNAFFASLPALQQDALLDLPASQFESELSAHMMAEKLLGDGSSLTKEQVLRLAAFSNAMKERARSFFNKGGRPPGSNGRDDRDRGDREPGGDRERDGRPPFGPPRDGNFRDGGFGGDGPPPRDGGFRGQRPPEGPPGRFNGRPPEQP